MSETKANRFKKQSAEDYIAYLLTIDGPRNLVERHLLSRHREMEAIEAHGPLVVEYVGGVMQRCAPTPGDAPMLIKELRAA